MQLRLQERGIALSGPLWGDWYDNKNRKGYQEAGAVNGSEGRKKKREKNLKLAVDGKQLGACGVVDGDGAGEQESVSYLGSKTRLQQRWDGIRINQQG